MNILQRKKFYKISKCVNCSFFKDYDKKEHNYKCMENNNFYSKVKKDVNFVYMCDKFKYKNVT